MFKARENYSEIWSELTIVKDWVFYNQQVAEKIFYLLIDLIACKKQQLTHL